MSNSVDTNSERTRVKPVFRWLRDHGGTEWPTRIVELTHGLAAPLEPGRLEELTFEEEVRVAPSAARLMWMIRNAEGLVPEDGSQWRELCTRVIKHPDRDGVLEVYDSGGQPTVPRQMILEGETHADCLIECTNALVWIEGKRNDWLSPSTKWDVSRDQLARNLEAAWLLASEKQKDFCVIICHEHPLKHHERLLVEGYRMGAWTGGWPHLETDIRELFSTRIGTLTWREMANEWPEITLLPELADLT